MPWVLAWISESLAQRRMRTGLPDDAAPLFAVPPHRPAPKRGRKVATKTRKRSAKSGRS
jgi:hypothetical protein